MIKYYIKKFFYIKTEELKETYSISFEDTMTLYDSKEEVYNRILREQVGLLKNNKKDLIDISLEEILKELEKDTFDISYKSRLSISEDIDFNELKSIPNGISSSVKNESLEMYSETCFYKIDKENALYALIDLGSDITKTKYFLKSGFSKNLEEISYIKSCSLDKDDYKQLAIFDKDDISDNYDLCSQIVLMVLDGEIDSENLKFFDDFIVSECFVNAKDEIIKNKQSLKNEIKQLKEDNKTLLNKIEELSYLNNKLDDELKKQKEKMLGIINIINKK